MLAPTLLASNVVPGLQRSFFFTVAEVPKKLVMALLDPSVPRPPRIALIASECAGSDP